MDKFNVTFQDTAESVEMHGQRVPAKDEKIYHEGRFYRVRQVVWASAVGMGVTVLGAHVTAVPLGEDDL